MSTCFHVFRANSFSNIRKQAYYVDLFVRVSNKNAIAMYKKMGYVVYRRVLGYYTGDPDEDAFGNFVDLV